MKTVIKIAVAACFVLGHVGLVYASGNESAVLANGITSTSFGTLDEPNSKIVDLPQGSRVIQLENGVTLADQATMTVVNADESLAAPLAEIVAGMKAKVVAEDASVQYYALEFGSAVLENIEIEDNDDIVSTFNGVIYTLLGKSTIRITGTSALTNSLIILSSEDSWVYFENLRPRVVATDFLNQIVIGDKPANRSDKPNDVGVNVRVDPYINGTVVIPHGPDYNALEIFDGSVFEGQSMKIKPFDYYKSEQLADMDKATSSFILKKGYMATFAQEEDGTGFSKVYVAEAQDIFIPQLPHQLDNDVSLVRVQPWRWVVKKGLSGGKFEALETLKIGWYYNWGNAQNSELDWEYVPMRHNLGWAPFGVTNEKIGSTHLLGFNEPDRPDQANHTVEQGINQWPKLLESGLRLGSPSPSDGGLNWLYDFMDQTNELEYRVDFAAVHFYRGCQTAQQYYDWLKRVHERTGLPIWITEWNNGAPWTTSCIPATLEDQAEKLESFMYMLDTTSFVERYSIFNFKNTWRLFDVPGEFATTAAGDAYRDHVSAKAYHHDAALLRSDTATLYFGDAKTISYSDQDISANVLLENNDSTLVLTDNTWRQTMKSYHITKRTVLEFEFRSTSEGEFHGVGFDSDNVLDESRMFQLSGTETTGVQTFNTYDNSGNWVKYEIPVGNYYRGTNMHLILANDNDAGLGNNGYFKNVKISDPQSESIPDTPLTLNAVSVASNHVNLSWENVPGSAEGHALERSTDGINFTRIAILDADANTYIDNGVSGETAYSYRIQSYNINGKSGYSDLANTLTLTDTYLLNVALKKPVEVDSESNPFLKDGAVDGNKTNNNNRWVSGDTEFPHWIEIDLLKKYDINEVRFWNGWEIYNNPIVDFQLQGWDGASWVDMLVVTDNDNPAFSASFPSYNTDKVRLYMTKKRPGAANNKVLFFEIEIYGGVTGLSDITSASELTVSKVSTSQLDLSWKDNSDNEDGFKVERKIGLGDDYEEIATLGVDATTYSDSKLSASTAYTYRVRPFNFVANGDYTPIATGRTDKCTDCIDFNVTTNVSMGTGGEAEVSIEDEGATLVITGNDWRRTEEEYILSSETVLEFEFMSTQEGEIHGIGFDDSGTENPDRIFRLFGTEKEFGSNQFRYVSNSGVYQKFSMPIGKIYTGDALHLVFANDNDNGAGNTSYFKNVKITGLGLPLSAEGISPAQDIVIHPNPGSHVLHITGLSGSAEIDLYHLTGRHMLKTVSRGDLDISFLEKGVYLIKINQGAFHRFVKQ